MSRLGIPLLRTAALTLTAATGTAAAALGLHATALVVRPGLGALLEYSAWSALLLAGCWSTLVLGLALWSGGTGRPVRLPCPRSWRPVIAALCGIGTALVVAGPAGAHDRPGLVPGPLPGLQRPTGVDADSSRHDAPILVGPGDSLWRIVTRRHSDEPAAATARRVERLYHANAKVIGPDPDLIRPGQQLVADDTREAGRSR